MSLQILDIVLYSNRGERRVLLLHPGEMNIITGDKKTGKTALISIVNYCLGSDKCTVPKGVIRNTVAWYGVRFTDGTSQHFVARRSPDQGKETTTDAYYAVGSEVELPESDALTATTNINTIVERLTNVVGIGLNVHEPPEGQTRDPLSAKLRHALWLAFQPQNEISQPDYLFHRQNDHWVAQAIKDTLPYFLGAVDDDFVAKKTRLKDVRRRLRDRERSLARFEAIAGEGLAGAAAMVSEARDIGILVSDAEPLNGDEAIQLLREAANASPEEQLIRYEEAIDHAEFDKLNSQRSRLREQLQRQHNELEAMRSLLADEAGFEREASEQLSRLSSLNIFPPAKGEPSCPLCEQPTPHLAKPDELQAEMQRAKSQLRTVAKHTPGLEALILDQESKIGETRRCLRENRASLEAIRQADDRLIALRDASARRAHVLGRVSLFLETLPEVADTSELRREIEELQAEVVQLQEELSDDKIQERLDSILSVLCKHMTQWAERLELEHRGNPFRLDLRKLQVVADTDTSPIAMESMGSGANWLGCHLIAHLALHSWFVRKQRPVPRFLFLDQPSQVYFPQDPDMSSSMEELKDEERLGVIRIFELIRDVVEELGAEFQVIITEHADPGEDWYQSAIVEKWRNGAALVPAEWINEPA